MTLEKLFTMPAASWQEMSADDIAEMYKDLINITRPSAELRARNSSGTRISKAQQEAEVLRTLTPEQRSRYENARMLSQQMGLEGFDMDDILQRIMK